jgi:DNA-binding CsgD family transcriptional regulator
MPVGYNLRFALAPHEHRVLALYGQGLDAVAIATRLGHSTTTITGWLSDLRARLDLPTPQALRAYAQTLGATP